MKIDNMIDDKKNDNARLVDIIEESLDRLDEEIFRTRSCLAASEDKKFIGDPYILTVEKLDFLKDMRDILKPYPNYTNHD